MRFPALTYLEIVLGIALVTVSAIGAHAQTDVLNPNSFSDWLTAAGCKDDGAGLRTVLDYVFGSTTGIGAVAAGFFARKHAALKAQVAQSAGTNPAPQGAKP